MMHLWFRYVFEIWGMLPGGSLWLISKVTGLNAAEKSKIESHQGVNLWYKIQISIAFILHVRDDLLSNDYIAITSSLEDDRNRKCTVRCHYNTIH